MLAKGEFGLCGPKKHLCTQVAAVAEAWHVVQGQNVITRQQSWQGTIKMLAATNTAPTKGACSCQGDML